MDSKQCQRQFPGYPFVTCGRNILFGFSLPVFIWYALCCSLSLYWCSSHTWDINLVVAWTNFSCISSYHCGKLLFFRLEKVSEDYYVECSSNIFNQPVRNFHDRRSLNRMCERINKTKTVIDKYHVHFLLSVYCVSITKKFVKNLSFLIHVTVKGLLLDYTVILRWLVNEKELHEGIYHFFSWSCINCWIVSIHNAVEEIRMM